MVIGYVIKNFNFTSDIVCSTTHRAHGIHAKSWSTKSSCKRYPSFLADRMKEDRSLKTTITCYKEN